MSVPRIAVIGVGGHGARHLSNAARLDAAGRVRLVAVGDPSRPDSSLIPAHTRWHPDGLTLIGVERVDVVVICTPIQTHFPIAAAAVRAGADVLLEKPTTATLAEYDELVALADAHSALVQIGFQSLGCSAIDVIRGRVAAGDLGEIRRYAATGNWVRDEAYWQRARWAGKRVLDGVVVADGVLTNPLAHATATALALAGAAGRDDVVSIDLELLRANPIEADDTSVAIMQLADGRRLTTAVTLAAARSEEPYVEVVGERATIRLYYKTGEVQTFVDGGALIAEEQFGFDDLLDNLLAARDGSARALVPIHQTGAFMRLVDAVMQGPAPREIRAGHVSRVEDDAGAHLVVTGVEAAIDEALRTERTFSALGAPFAVDAVSA